MINILSLFLKFQISQYLTKNNTFKKNWNVTISKSRNEIRSHDLQVCSYPLTYFSTLLGTNSREGKYTKLYFNLFYISINTYSVNQLNSKMVKNEFSIHENHYLNNDDCLNNYIFKKEKKTKHITTTNTYLILCFRVN